MNKFQYDGSINVREDDGKTTDLREDTLFCRRSDTIVPTESYPVYFLFFHFSSYLHTCWSFSIIRESYSSPQCLEYGDLAAPLLKNVVKRRGEMLVLPVISVLDLSLSSVVRSVRTSCG